jgi:hypothetical protein
MTAGMEEYREKEPFRAGNPGKVIGREKIRNREPIRHSLEIHSES